MNINTKIKQLTFTRRQEQKLKQTCTTKRGQNKLNLKISKALEKLLGNLKISEITDLISSGKEAVVYKAFGSAGEPLAIKVYERSAMDFKKREKYFCGDRRFSNIHLRSNARKMVKLWAEKEYRNLKIIEREQILCPSPVLVRNHLLIMTFIGDTERAAPRLKDVEFDHKLFINFYIQCLLILRKLYGKCGLVHADFSEYNLLVKDDVVILIDVGSAVSVSHVNAYEFLISDCLNIFSFFAKNKVKILSLKEVLDFVYKGKHVVNDEIETNESKPENSEFDILNKINLEKMIDYRLENKYAESDSEILEKILSTIAPSSLHEIDEIEMFEELPNKLAISHLVKEDNADDAQENSDDTVKESDECYDTESECSEFGEVYESGNDNEIKSKNNEKMKKDLVNAEKKRKRKEFKARRREKLLTKTPKSVKKRKEKILKSRRNGK